MDTREGREAYEASFGVKIGTPGDRDIAMGTPPRAAVPHRAWWDRKLRDLDRSTPGSSPQQAKGALAGDPVMPLAHDDRLKRGEFCAAWL